MEVNARFDEPVLVHTDRLDWHASPMAGVDRRMLDRIGGEVARATSLVRYAEGSAFAEHTHSGGEEFIVLDGVFQDEHGDYPAGTYVRNPIDTHHIPRSGPGCTIFVKLWQFDEADQEQVALNLDTLETTPDPVQPGVRSATLAARDYEHVALEEWGESRSIEMNASGGFEILILAGTLSHGDVTFSQQDWIRWPDGKPATFETGDAGARLWIKRGHLKNIRVPGQKPQELL